MESLRLLNIIGNGNDLNKYSRTFYLAQVVTRKLGQGVFGGLG